MAPALFDLYICLVIECWQARVKDLPGVGITLKHKYDGKLFRRYTRNASERKLLEFLFADDGAIFASSRVGVVEFQSVCQSFGLTVSISKTKHIAAGREITSPDKTPLQLNGGTIDCGLVQISGV